MLKQIEEVCGEWLWEFVTEPGVWIAGGTLSSIACNREVNDIDVYFEDEACMKKVLGSLRKDGSFSPLVITDRAVSIYDYYQDRVVQFITYKTFPTMKELFKSFDFTVCMGACSPSQGIEEYHPDFWPHNSQRVLNFNEGTDFPLASVMRVHKYREKGYSISKAQMVKMLLRVSQLDIKSWEDLKEQVGGQYGEELLSLNSTKEWSLEAAYKALEDAKPKRQGAENELEFFQKLDKLLGLESKPF